MFSVKQKRQIADAVQQILRETNHPELPVGEINFYLHVDGAENWSWADIKNNGAVTNPGVNPWNEAQTHRPTPQPVAVRPTDEEIMELMPQQMRDDLAAAARALTGDMPWPDNPKAACAMRIILNRHAVDHARAVLDKWGNQ